MKVTVFLVVSMLMLAVLTDAGKRQRRSSSQSSEEDSTHEDSSQEDSSQEDQVVPTKRCSKGLLDPDSCTCKCNAIGPLAPPLFCWINRILCGAQGKALTEGCCEGYQSECGAVWPI